ncbi:MAG TPA: ATP-binding protein [Phycisphaerales bacterium]|nr:ATP-binding protein [Phycisphaerales bacterium]
MSEVANGVQTACEASVHNAGPGGYWDGFVNFWTGNGSYMPRTHCMVTAEGKPDWPWIIALVFLTTLVIGAYARIFVFWRCSYLEVAPPDRNRKLMQLAWIFALCAVCGYAMSILAFVWPAYRLLTCLMVVLVFWSWKFAFSLGEFRVSFEARRYQRELHETLKNREIELERLVSLRTQELEAARREADAANVAKSAFLANMSHEIRTPMTAILGFSELLRSEDLSDQEKGEYLELVRRHGEHLLAIINDILDLSKIEAGELKLESIPCDPAQIVRDVCASLRHVTAAKGVELVAHVQAGFPETVRSDPTRLRQILLNLVGNSTKFTSRGSIDVVCGATHTEDGRWLLSLAVRDTGIGMTGEQMSSLFRPFTQADASTTRKFGGTGLGLAISRHIALALGGTLRVSSEPGIGSTFTLEIPAGAAEGEAVVSGSARSTGGRTRFRSSDRVLIADDAPDIRRLVTYVLEKAGATVECVADGVEAVEMIAREHAAGRDYSLVLMDVDMPRLDGITAAKELRSRGINVPLIAITAHAMATDVARSLACGFDAHLPKPVNRDVLVSACLRAIIAHQRQNDSGAIAA